MIKLLPPLPLLVLLVLILLCHLRYADDGIRSNDTILLDIYA